MRVGDTAVVCGVRAETLLVSDVPDYRPRPAVPAGGADKEGQRVAEKRRRREDADEMARLNLLVPNLELATGCTPAHLPGGPPSSLAQTLAQRILTLLHTSQLLDLEDLRIWHHPPSSSLEGKMDTSTDDSSNDSGDDVEDDPQSRPEIKAFWTLYIDMVFISLDGNPFDAAWGSLLAALADVRLPRAWWDADLEKVLCDDNVAVSKRLGLRDIPVAMSFGVFEAQGAAKGKSGKWVLIDMDGFEEGLCSEGGTVVVREGGEIVRIEKVGGGHVGMGEMREMVALAQDRWREWRDVLGRVRLPKGGNGWR